MLVGRMADLHFAPTETARQSLLAENVAEENIIVTGNTVIDALQQVVARFGSDAALNEEMRARFSFLEEGKRMILVTGHRRENFGQGFENICQALRGISEESDVQIVYPVHLNPNVQEPVKRILGDAAAVHLIEPQDYLPFVWLMQRSHFLITDSGGVQEEAPSLGKPVLVMQDIVQVLDGHTAAGLFFETPDVQRVLQEGAFWDIYYEHCSYFTQGSHARLFRRAGFDVTGLYLAYDGQYIIQYAAPAAGRPALPQEDDLETVRALAARFPQKVAEVRRHWTEFVRSRHAAGQRVAIWGGGSKGVSFLTTNGLGQEVAQVIDINPFKQGKYLPGTGHPVSAPDSLQAAPPDTVIVMR